MTRSSPFHLDMPGERGGGGGGGREEGREGGRERMRERKARKGRVREKRE